MYELAYILLLLIILTGIGLAFNNACVKAGMINEKRRRFVGNYTLLMLFWVGYVTGVSFTGFFAVFSLPPRILLFIIVPIFGLIVWFFVSGRFRDIIQAFSLPFTVYFQSFRIAVELLILGLYLKGIGPVHATFEGYNFDIIAGLTAPVAGWLAFSRKAISYKALIAWNIACLLLLANIVFLFNSLIMKPQLWGFSEPPISKRFATAPYLYIAAVYMPAAVFLHAMSLRKLLLLLKDKKGVLTA